MFDHHKIFRVTVSNEIVVVTPVPDVSNFRYQDLQAEANAIRGHISRKSGTHLVINLEEVDYFGSEFLGAMVLMLRETKTRGGRACFCHGKTEAIQVHMNSALTKLWPHFTTHAAAVAFVKGMMPTESSTVNEAAS